jgi:hypothetical protein
VGVLFHGNAPEKLILKNTSQYRHNKGRDKNFAMPVFGHFDQYRSCAGTLPLPRKDRKKYLRDNN